MVNYSDWDAKNTAPAKEISAEEKRAMRLVLAGAVALIAAVVLAGRYMYLLY